MRMRVAETEKNLKRGVLVRTMWIRGSNQARLAFGAWELIERVII